MAAYTASILDFSNGRDELYTNYVWNDFGVNATNWNLFVGAGITGASSGRQTADLPSGPAGVVGTGFTKGTSTGIANGYLSAVWPNTLTNAMPVVPGDVVTVSFWAKSASPPTSGGVIYPMMSWLDASTTLLSFANPSAASLPDPTDGLWYQYVFTATAPASSAYVLFRVNLSSNLSPFGSIPSGVWELRVAAPYIGRGPSDFFSGSSGAGGTWTGTAEASPSVKGAASPVRAYTGARTPSDVGSGSDVPTRAFTGVRMTPGISGGMGDLALGDDGARNYAPNPRPQPGTITGYAATTGAGPLSAVTDAQGDPAIQSTMGASGGGIYVSQGMLQSVPGRTIRVEAVVSLDVGGTVLIDVTDNVAEGQNSGGTWNLAPNTPTLISFSCTPAAARVKHVVIRTSVANAVVRIKKVAVRLDGGGYFDPNITPNQFEGAVGNSISIAPSVTRQTGAVRGKAEFPVAPAEGDWTNLLTNPSAELAIGNWNVLSGVTLTRDTTWAARGTYSLRATRTTTGVGYEEISLNSVGGSGANIVANGAPVTPGLPYSAACRFNIYDPSATYQPRLQMEFFNGSGTSLGRLNGPALPVGTSGEGWATIVNQVAPAGAAVVRIMMIFHAGQDTGLVDTVDCAGDGFVIVQSAVVPPSFDGDSPSSTWSGAAHASSSRLMTLMRSTAATRALTAPGWGSEGGQNLMPAATDVSLEHALAGWNQFVTAGATATFVVDESWGTHGPSLHVFGNLANSGSYSEVSLYQNTGAANAAPVVAGQTYTARCDYRQNINASRGPTLYIRFYDAAFSTVLSQPGVSGSAVAGTTGTLVNTAVAPANAAYAVLLLVCNGATGTGQAFDLNWDAVAFYNGATDLTPYVANWARPATRAYTGTRAPNEQARSSDEWTNVFTNPAFNTAISPWGHWFGNDTAAFDSAVSHSGSGGSLRSTITAAQSFVGVAMSSPLLTSFAEGLWYFSMWVMTSTNVTARLELRNNPSLWSIAGPTYTFPAMTWTQVAYAGFMPPASKALNVNLIVVLNRAGSAGGDGLNWATNDQIWWDEALMTPYFGVVPTPNYFDGASDPNAHWLGAANSSQSAYPRVVRTMVAGRSQSDAAGGADTLTRTLIYFRSTLDAGFGFDLTGPSPGKLVVNEGLAWRAVVEELVQASLAVGEARQYTLAVEEAL